MNTCNAVGKAGSETLICDLAHGHTGDHATWTPAGGKITWPQEQW